MRRRTIHVGPAAVVLLAVVAMLAGCTDRAGSAVSALSPGEAQALAEELAGSTVEEIPAIAGPDAVEVEPVEDGESTWPDAPVWFTAIDCEDGSRIATQVSVRDSRGDVHGVAISLDC